MKGHWSLEKEIIQKIRDIKARIEEAGVEEQRAQRAGDLSKVAEIRYGRIVELEKTDWPLKMNAWPQIQQDRKMLKEEVDEEDVASVVAKWTGIPVDNLLASEKDKLVHAEEFMRQEGCWPDRGHRSCCQCGAAGPGRPAGSEPTARVLYLPGTHRCRQDGIGPHPGRVPF